MMMLMLSIALMVMMTASVATSLLWEEDS